MTQENYIGVLMMQMGSVRPTLWNIKYVKYVSQEQSTSMTKSTLIVHC